MFARRTFLATGLVASAGALVGARPPSLLDAAIARAGGTRALASAKILSWTGTAIVNAGGRSLEIGISARVEPFARARTDSWPASEGRAGMRSLIIDGAQGWIERGGTRSPMPPAMLIHERAQYALYGLMKLVTARDPGARAEPGPGPDSLIIHHPLAPTTTFGFTSNASLAWAANQVPASDGPGTIDQRFDFSGRMLSAGVYWPQRLQIAEGGSPYFDLRLDSFTASSR